MEPVHCSLLHENFSCFVELYQPGQPVRRLPVTFTPKLVSFVDSNMDPVPIHPDLQEVWSKTDIAWLDSVWILLPADTSGAGRGE